MKGHLGAVLTSGLAAIALALALLQAAVVSHGVIPAEPIVSSRTGSTNRFSAPGGRAGVPWVPDSASQPKPALPENPEGRTPGRKEEQQHRSPPPSRFRNGPPRLGPQPARKVMA
jgi:hypothetical protein